MGNCPQCGADLTPRRISDRLRTVNLPEYDGSAAEDDDDEHEEDQPEILILPKGVGPDLEVGSLGKPEDTRLPHQAAPPIEPRPTSDAADVLKQLLDNTGHEDVPPPDPEALLSRVSLLEGMRESGLDGEDLVRAAGLLRSAFGLVLVAVPPSREGTGTVFSELSNRTTEPTRTACLVMKDLESGKQAVHLAIRGSLVFTLLEAGDSRGAMLRLDSDLQVDRALSAASLRGVIAERPMRAICDSCREPHEPEKDTRSALRLGGTEGPFFHGAGCANCDYTGYKGEASIFETLSLNRLLRDMLSRGESGDRVWTAALHSGELRSFREAGIAALHAGATSPLELVRVLEAS